MTTPSPGNPVLDLEMRRRLHAAVQEFPGIHVREVARQLDTSIALVEYHLNVLVHNGLVVAEKGDRYVRIYPAGKETPSPADRETVAVLRERLPLQIVLHLLDHGASRHKDVAAALGMSKSKLSFHLRKLEAGGLVGRDAEGRFSVLDRRRVERLLLSYPPTRDLRTAFAAVWLSLYGNK